MDEEEGLCRLLVSGGDSRTAVDESSLRSKYLVPLRPNDELLSFASSTASPLLPSALVVARTQEKKKSNEERKDKSSSNNNNNMDEKKKKTEDWNDKNNKDDMTTTDINKDESIDDWEELRSRLAALLMLDTARHVLVLTSSGTDAQLLAIGAARAKKVVVACADETGSGTVFVAKGQLFDGEDRGKVVLPHVEHTFFVPSSHPAVISGEDEILLAMDCSKVGSSSDLHGARCIIDACQMRLSLNRLNALLDCGHIVVATLSKFFCGPAFCGMVLCSKSVVVPETRPLSRGAFLRFCVAEATLRDYFALPVQLRCHVVRMFVDAVKNALLKRPHRFRIRSPTKVGSFGWPCCDNEEFSVPTIISFAVLEADGRPMDLAAVTRLYTYLATERNVLVGQPVALPDVPVLRMSCDARWVIKLASEKEPEKYLQMALRFLDDL